MSYSHHAWAQRNLDAWLDKYDAANESPGGFLEHEDVTEIPLRGADGAPRAYAIVDGDFAHLLQFHWHISNEGYAQRNLPPVDRRRRMEKLHRAVLGLEVGDGLLCDHINGDRLDCRLSNLRVVTLGENAQNRRKQAGSSRYRGVTRRKGRWIAQAQVGGQKRHLGSFITEEEAGAVARAFRAAHMPYSNEERATAANEDEHGRLEHEAPPPARLHEIRIRRAHDRLRGLSTAEILARHPDWEAA